MTISDTAVEATEFQITVLQAKTPSQRLALTLTLSDTAIGLSRRAIRRANPEFSEEEVRCRFVELHYGAHLAKALRQYLSERYHDPNK